MSIKLFEVPTYSKREILDMIWEEVDKLLPQWDDRSELDPGVVLANAVATVLENLYSAMQVYHDNLIIRFAELLGISPTDGAKAKASVTIKFERVYYPFVIKKGTRFATNPLESGASLIFHASDNVFVNDNNQNPGVPIEIVVPVECAVKGTIGNVPDNAIDIIIDPLEANGEIISSSRGIGGEDEDNFESIRKKIVSLLSVSNRAVTKNDYEDLVKGLSYIRNCYVWARYNPDDYLSEKPGNIGIIPIPEPGFSFEDIKDQLIAYLEPRAVLTARIYLISPESQIPPVVKNLEITRLDVRISEDYSIESVRQALKVAIETKLSPYESAFGKAITISDIYNIVFSIDGVKELIELETEPDLPLNLLHFQIPKATVNINNIHVYI